MPYPMFKTTAAATTSRPTISRPLPLRAYQDQEHNHQSSSSSSASRWSMSETSDAPLAETHPRPSFWPNLLPTLPPRSPLRPRLLNRPHAPPALTRNFHAAAAGHHDADLEYYFDDAIHTPMTATSTSSSSTRSLTPSPASAPPYHTTFASADSSSLNKWLTVGHQRYLSSRRLGANAAAASSGPKRGFANRERELPLPPLPPAPLPKHDHDDGDEDFSDEQAADSLYDYTDYLQQTASPIPPPESLSLCNSSGWSCVARRSARSP